MASKAWVREYCRFPQQVELMQKYRYISDLGFLIRIMANMTGKFGMFNTYSPSSPSKRIQAKREIEVEIAKSGTEFEHLQLENVDEFLKKVPAEGTLDFKVNLKYSYLDENYNRVPFRGDSFFVRAQQTGDILTLMIHLAEGPKRTECARIADTIVDEIRREALKSTQQW